MSRQVVLDTETTGLETSQGHRIIEIGCVELVNRRITKRHFHEYLQPDRAIDIGAEEVHGITNEFLRDKPRFADIADDFLAFVDGAELVIHNAAFDQGFIDYELGRIPGPVRRIQDCCEILDSLALARQLHPGQKNSLDALCRRYAVSNAHRDLHGALLDAEILADVYLVMTGGQVALELVSNRPRPTRESRHAAGTAANRGPLKVIRAADAELVAHLSRLEDIKKESGRCVWQELEAASEG